MIRKLSIISILALVFGCSEGEKNNEQRTLKPGNAIIGLAGPIKLHQDSTTVFLLDYFENANQIDSVFFNSNMNFSFDKASGEIEIKEFSGSNPIAVLSAIYAGEQYDIPVFRSRVLPFKYSYKSENQNLERVSLKGSFNSWNPSATKLNRNGASWTTNLFLEPGLYEYLVVEDGKEMIDSNNKEKKDNGMGKFNSTFRVGYENKSSTISTFGSLGDSIVIYYPRELKAPHVFWENHRLDSSWYQRKSDRLSINLPLAAAKTVRSSLRLFADNGEQRTNDLLIPLGNGKPIENPSKLPRTDKRKLAMYFIMVDRFLNGESSNDLLVNDPQILPPANYYGGDLKGVATKVEDGYLNNLGINTLWLSPITQNPLGAYGLWDKGGVRSKFSGYHGYWPISSSHVDLRFGDDVILNNLIDNAHAKELNVILDYVANHVHQEHPVYRDHPDWATDLYLPDGTLNTEKWDEHRLTTWFDTFLPTLDFGKNEVVEAMTDSAVYWFEKHLIDGFRHDATKHIPLKFWRELTRKLKYRVVKPDNRPVYQIGETYGNPQLIDSYVGSGLLDGQFDFNLYDASVSAFAKDDESFENLNRVLNQSLTTYGYHHLMGNISGNQDRTRFISYADGSVKFDEDQKLAGWTREVEVKDSIGYSRLAMLHAFNFSVPGVPVIYYGDEIGLPGANDPDNRRMMRFGENLIRPEKALLKTVSKIANLRQNKMALIYGDFELLKSNGQVYAYIRNYFEQTAIVIFNTSRVAKKISLEIPTHYSLDNVQANFGHRFTTNGREINVIIPPVSFEIITN